MILPDERIKLIEIANESIIKAYAPYSNFRVGACVLTESGNFYPGCNIENASYSLTICAERVAICTAISYEGSQKMKIKALAVFTEHNLPCSPCGSCRQFIYEFGQDALVIFEGESGLEQETIIRLLPHAFSLKIDK